MAKFYGAAQQDTDDETPELGRLALKVGELRAALDAAAAPYEQSGPLTFGGIPATLPYTLRAPFSTACEVCVLAVGFTDAASCVLSTSDGQSVPTTTGTVDGNGQQFAMYFAKATADTVTPAAVWHCVPQGGTLKLYVAGSANHSVFATVVYRKRVNPAGVPVEGY